MSGFSANRLQQREPFDAAARDRNLARRFATVLGAGYGGSRRIVDLAAGTGANFRALAPLLGGDQEWLLVDRDPLLMAAQAAHIARWSERAGWRCHNIDGGVLVDTGIARWRVRAQQLDLARCLEQFDLGNCDGVTTSAFLDLVSAAWLERLCDILKRCGRPLLATLTVDGRRSWHPPLPADTRMHDAFQRHQSGDKGFGPALGNIATTYLADRLAAMGFKVSTACSDWRIDAQHRAMLAHMIEESAAVACNTDPDAAALFAGWLAERKAHVQCGLLALEVGHLDLLALPDSCVPANSIR